MQIANKMPLCAHNKGRKRLVANAIELMWLTDARPCELTAGYEQRTCICILINKPVLGRTSVTSVISSYKVTKRLFTAETGPETGTKMSATTLDDRLYNIHFIQHTFVKLVMRYVGMYKVKCLFFFLQSLSTGKHM